MKITEQACKQVIKDNNLKGIPLRRCSVCQCQIGFLFAIAGNVYQTPELAGYDKDDLIVGYDPECDCTHTMGFVQSRTWDQFINTFTSKDEETKMKMWERFNKGEMLYDQ